MVNIVQTRSREGRRNMNHTQPHICGTSLTALLPHCSRAIKFSEDGRRIGIIAVYVARQVDNASGHQC
jgi:hypothetical protein